MCSLTYSTCTVMFVYSFMPVRNQFAPWSHGTQKHNRSRLMSMFLNLWSDSAWVPLISFAHK